MEGKTSLKLFDGLTRLTLTPIFYDRSTPLAVQQMTVMCAERGGELTARPTK